MTATRKRYDTKYKVTRVSLRTYRLLKDTSENTGLSMAEVLDKLVDSIDTRSIPVTSAGSMPAFRVTSMPVFRVAPVTTIAINGSKAAAFKIKPKGVRDERAS